MYIQAFMYLSLARTSLHIMNLQIRVERGGEKRDKKFQMVKKSILLITNIYIYKISTYPQKTHRYTYRIHISSYTNYFIKFLKKVGCSGQNTIKVLSGFTYMFDEISIELDLLFLLLFLKIYQEKKTRIDL